MSQTWIIKDKEEKISGPHQTDEVIQLIEAGHLVGEEQISKYPHERWQQISQCPQFYDALLLSVAKERSKTSTFSQNETNPDQQKIINETEVLQSQTEQIQDQTEQTDGKTVPIEEKIQNSDSSKIVDQNILDQSLDDARTVQQIKESEEPSLQTGSAKRKKQDLPSFEKDSFISSNDFHSNKEQPQPNVSHFNKKPDQQEPSSHPAKDEADQSFLPALPPEVPSKLKKVKKKFRRPRILLLIIFIFLVSLFFLEDEKTEETETEHITLLFPSTFKINQLSQSDLQKRFTEASQFFYRDTYTSYIKAQELLIALAEDASDVPEVLSFLCLTHRELWPYSKQTSDDRIAISQVTQRMSKVQSIGVHQDICNIVKYLLSDQIDIASAIIDKSLESYPENPMLYELKAERLAEKRQYNAAVAYIQRSQSLLKGWLKTYLREAEYNMANGEFLDAKDILRKIYLTYPSHILSSIWLGYLNLKIFNKHQEGLSLIKKGLKTDNVLLPTVESKVTFALAQYYYGQGQKGLALEYAQQSYHKDLSNASARAFILEVGGPDALSKIESTDEQVIALGDFFYKKKNFLAAQAQYKAAYEQNPRNGLAALKAGQTLWNLNLQQEAIEWVKKAVVSSPRLIEAHITLSDYLSQRYHFNLAMATLTQLTRIAPQNYEMIKGMAFLQWRRQDYEKAESSARKALNLYDTDIELNILFSETLYKLGKYEEAFQVISKTLELTGQNIKAQGVYSKVLASVQTVGFSIDYLNELIERVPRILEYHLFLAEIYQTDQKYEKAEAVLKPVITRLNQSLGHIKIKKKAYALLGEVYVAMKDYNQAIGAYINAALADPSDAKPLFQMAILYIDAQKYEEAIHQLQRVLTINERYPKAHFYIGTASLNLGRSNSALEAAKKEKQINPSLADPYVLAGKVYMKTGHYGKAIAELQKAIKISPQGGQIYILLARAYRLANNFDVAEQMIVQAEKLATGDPTIYREQGEIFESKGQVQQAIGAYNLYIQLSPNTYDRQAIESKILRLSRQ